VDFVEDFNFARGYLLSYHFIMIENPTFLHLITFKCHKATRITHLDNNLVTSHQRIIKNVSISMKKIFKDKLQQKGNKTPEN